MEPILMILVLDAHRPVYFFPVFSPFTPLVCFMYFGVCTLYLLQFCSCCGTTLLVYVDMFLHFSRCSAAVPGIVLVRLRR